MRKRAAVLDRCGKLKRFTFASDVGAEPFDRLVVLETPGPGKAERVVAQVCGRRIFNEPQSQEKRED